MIENNLNSFDNDIFNRKVIAQNLTKIIESKENPMVMSLDSDWGTGKTTFVTMWKNMLDNDSKYNNKFKTLYFNAWEHDYIKDPLLAIFSEMEVQIKEEDGELKKKLDNVKNKLRPMTKLAATTGLKILTAGMLDIDKINLGDYNEEQLIELAGKVGELTIAEVSAGKKVRAELKESMVNYQSESGKKIIFFIDELDRCRPTFAIELLEVIKHLFDIENFVFVISIDKEQLSHSVSTIYGKDMDTIGYLRRFFDLDYKLPKLDLKKYVDSKNSVVFENYKNTEYMQFFLKELFSLYKFSLRDVDKAYYYIELLLPLIEQFSGEKSDKAVYSATIGYIYSTLIAIKIKNPILYKRVIEGDYTIDKLVEELENVDITYYGETRIYDYHSKVLQSIINPILKIYLELNLKYINQQKLYSLEEDGYTVGIKNEDGRFYFEHRFNLIYLFDNNNIINDRLEFLEGF